MLFFGVYLGTFRIKNIIFSSNAGDVLNITKNM